MAWSSGWRLDPDRRDSNGPTRAASTTTTWCATSAAGWWRSTTLRSNRRSARSPSASACASSITTWCCAVPARSASERRLPGVDVRPPLAGLPAPLGLGRIEQRGDPAPAVGRVDHVVDLEVGGHVDALASFVGGGHGGFVGLLALRRI